VRRLRDAGHVAYFAGGCVRDQLLGLEPKDYDVATDATPDRVRQLFSNTQAVGAAFGVILVRHRKSQIEVATFRTDGKYLDGRRPEGVTFATAEEDAKRRDFTINGMFFDPIEERVIDYVGGQEDLKAELIRAIGDPEARFAEDHLRLLRAVRFAVRLSFRVEPRTADAIRHHAPHLVRVSPERIADELRRMLVGGYAFDAWSALLEDFPGLADVIFRFLPPPPVKRRTLGIIKPALSFPFSFALAAAALEWVILQHDAEDIRPLLEKAGLQRLVRALRQSLRISNEEADDVHGTLEGVAILLKEYPPPVAVAKRFLARPTAEFSREVLRSLPSHTGWELSRGLNRIGQICAQLHDLEQTEFAPAPLVSGDDLTAAGLKPGPLFKRVLDAVYDAQLEDRVKTKDDALQLALKLAQLSS
jgi:poly(A) polymerase